MACLVSTWTADPHGRVHRTRFGFTPTGFRWATLPVRSSDPIHSERSKPSASEYTLSYITTGVKRNQGAITMFSLTVSAWARRKRPRTEPGPFFPHRLQMSSGPSRVRTCLSGYGVGPARSTVESACLSPSSRHHQARPQPSPRSPPAPTPVTSLSTGNPETVPSGVAIGPTAGWIESWPRACATTGRPL